MRKKTHVCTNYLGEFFLHLNQPAIVLREEQDGVNLVAANPAFEELLKVPCAAPLPFSELPLPTEWTVQMMKSCLSLKDKESAHIELEIFEGAQTRWYQLSLSKKKQDEHWLYFCLFTNVSQREKESLRLKQRITDIDRLKKQLQSQSIRDPLTNLFNRRFLTELFEREIALANRTNSPLSLVMLDLDNFKAINDTYGHQTGDAVITLVAKLLQSFSRRSDVLFRYGGEEFLVLLPNTSTAQALKLTEQWRLQIEKSLIKVEEKQIHITVSAGITCFLIDSSVENFILAADKALYQAKAAGRNKVIVKQLVE